MNDKQKYVAYYRVSTDKQGVRGLGMESQQKMVEDYIEKVNGVLINSILEVESGTKNNRPLIKEALSQCKREKAVLAVAKLDRLARDVLFMAQLVNSKIKFVAVETPDIDKNYIYMKAVFSEMETDMISARTKAALSILKARGVKLGSKKLELLIAENYKKSIERLIKIKPIFDEFIVKGYSQRKIVRELEILKIKSPYGREKWSQKQVCKTLKNLKNQKLSPCQENI